MIRKNVLLILVLALTAFSLGDADSIRADAAQQRKFTIRTENFPRPPYSGATYYIYESEGEVVCTKLEVCNKYDNCSTTYHKGVFKDEEDVQTGEPYGSTKPVRIALAKLRKHFCLTKFKLIK